MVSLAQIDYILALLEYRNFQKASEACFVTQPTLSMQVKKAEEILGNNLINRDTNPLSLTTFGQEIIPYLLKIKEEYESLRVSVEKYSGIYKAEIRLGIIPTIAGYMVPEMYAQWQQELGEIRFEIIELKTEQILQALETKKIDLGIMAGPLNNSRFRDQILFNEEILIYAPHVKGQLISEEDLNKEKPWLLSQGNCLRTQMINFCNLNESQKDEWNYEGGSLHILINMVKQQGGYTLVPANYVPHLNLSSDHFKSLTGHTPIRQVIGVHSERNSKREYLNRLMRVIQSAQPKRKISSENTSLLPWT
ncbi:MAG: LysR substrate-binding domain-containing protein [Brumimicrobium sp.]|nr:LysR substrate-binding domain-containing protein [Brumimicrobium sp.]